MRIRIRTKMIDLLILLVFGLLMTPTLAYSQANDGTGWINMKPSTAPSARDNNKLTYDSESDRVILFGGKFKAVTQERFNDTWAYDYNTDTWEEMTPTLSPGHRNGHTMAYDSESDRSILFGGLKTYFAPPTPVECWNDTWTYDYNADTWVEMYPTVKPPTRTGAAMVYDSESDKIILFGGFTEERTDLGDTWTYDYNSNNWTEMDPLVSPTPRYYPGMAYDCESDRVIMFSGMYQSSVLGDTWAYDYDSNIWEHLTPASNPPSRTLASLTYDKSADKIILYGGSGASKTDVYSDTWAYDYNTNTWTELVHNTHPAGSYYIDLTHDTESNCSILFGGTTGDGVRSDETWTYFYTDKPVSTPGFELISLLIGIIMLKKKEKSHSSS